MAEQEQLKPLKTFLAENIAFMSANLYLLTVQVDAHSRLESEISKEYGDFAAKIAPTYKSPTSYLMSRLFISYVAAFEIFLQETIILVVQKNPKKVGAINFSLADVLDSNGVEQLIQRATDEVLNKLMYKKPSEYLKEISGLLSINEAPLRENWKIFVEAKARRDLGVHNAWRCNDIYLRKLSEAELVTAATTGTSMAPQDKSYFDAATAALTSLASNISAQVISKHWPQTNLSTIAPSIPN